MANSYFRFKQFTVHQDHCAMKVTTDACLFGAWSAEKIKSHELKVKSILDIGTGTGLLSLMLAQKINASIDAVEIDKEAAEQAKVNAIASPWKERICIVQGDIKSAPVLPEKKYDTIICNPPFYENELITEDTRKNIAHHGEGLLISELLMLLTRKLEVNGRFYLLLPYKRKTEVLQLIGKYPLSVTHITLVKQSARHSYFRIFITGRQAGNSNEPYSKNEISIWNDKEQYSDEFIQLLKEYYLYL